MEEKNEEGLSIGEFFKLVWTQKILAAILLVVITLVGTLGIYYGYNAMSKEYSVTYRMNFPGSSDFYSDYTYPDGTVFYYTSLVSSETLEIVKAKDSRFSGIKDSDITITYNAEGTEEITIPTFTLTARAGSFRNDTIARDFLVELSRYPAEHFADISYDYHTALDTYNLSKVDRVTNYDSLINILNGQLSMIQSMYADLVSTYGSSFTLTTLEGNVTTLSAFKSEVDAYVQSNVIGMTALDISLNGKLKSEDIRTSLTLQQTNLQIQLAAAQDTLDFIIANQKEGDTGSTAVLRDQKTLINSLQNELDTVNGYINNEIDTEYISNLDSIYTVLDGFTTELEAISRQINQRVATITYMSNEIMEVSETGVAISFVISLLVGLLVSIITSYIVATSKIKKSLKEAKPLEETSKE